MEEKIKKLKRDIEEMSEKKKEMDRKYNNQIAELKKKLAEAQKEVSIKKNQLIADAVRDICGEMNEAQLEEFKRKISHWGKQQHHHQDNFGKEN